MTLELSYFGIKRPFSNCPYRKQIGILICLSLGVTFLDSTAEIKLMLSYQCTVGAPVYISKASVYLCIALVFLKALYIHIIFPSVKSEAVAS